jgi:succinyl-CoA synthetase beta subunit
MYGLWLVGLTTVVFRIKDKTYGDGGMMAKFFEYQGKEIFSKSGIPIPEGVVANSPEEARKAAEKLGRPVVVKAQVWAGGRGKSGAVKFADTPDEAEKVAAEILRKSWGWKLKDSRSNRSWLRKSLISFRNFTLV